MYCFLQVIAMSTAPAGIPHNIVQSFPYHSLVVSFCYTLDFGIGTLHGFGSWFDVRFGDIPEDYRYKPVSLSTSPSDP